MAGDPATLAYVLQVALKLGLGDRFSMKDGGKGSWGRRHSKALNLMQ